MSLASLTTHIWYSLRIFCAWEFFFVKMSQKQSISFCICAFAYIVENMTEEVTLKYYLPTHIFSHFLRAVRVALELNVWSELLSVGQENVISKYRIPH